MALDVDLPAADLSCQSDVLTFLADRKRKLIVRYHDRRRLFAVLRRKHFFDLGRAEYAGDQFLRILAPCDDVDFFSVQLVNDGLHTRAARTDTGADRIDVLEFRINRHLGSGAGFSGDTLDLNGSVLNLRYLQFKQALDQSRMGAGKEYLRALVGLFDIHDVDLESVVNFVVFSRHLFVRGEDAFGSADIDEQRFVADALHRSGHDLALTGNVIVKDHAALRLADPLYDDLLGGLCRDTAEVSRRDLIFHHVTDFIAIVDIPGLV